MLTKNEIFALSLVDGVGSKSIQNIINANISINDFDVNTLTQAIKGPKKKIAIDQILNNFEKFVDMAELSIINLRDENINLISCLDSEYPKSFSNIHDKPIFLFAKGNLDLLNHNKSIAVVGSRKCSSFGKMAAFKTAEYFAEQNFNIVSGLALGIDTEAHKGALTVNGLTTAVLIDVQNVAPLENVELSKNILDQNGLLISENPPGTFPQAGLYVNRNRLQSGLSQSVFVIETSLNGGTMHTAKFAMEQKKLLFCPDLLSFNDYPKDFEASQGILKLINENKAESYNKSKYQYVLEKINNNQG